MKRILILLLAFFFIITLSSCKLGFNNNLSAITTSSESKSSNQNSISNSKIVNVLFIGNSLTFVGQIPQKFESLLKLTNKSVNMFEKTNGGYKLSQHLTDLKSGSYNDIIEKADTVILQEYGSYGLDTANSIIQIQKLFKSNTRFYYLLTEFDIPQRLTELKDIKNITYIPSGYSHNLLLKGVFTYDQLHAINDYHPNSLYGYIAALTVYSKLFNTSCIGLSYDFLDENTIALIPGDTKAEKDKTINKIQTKVMVAVKAKQSDYK
jgi:hypothetical protein